MFIFGKKKDNNRFMFKLSVFVVVIIAIILFVVQFQNKAVRKIDQIDQINQINQIDQIETHVESTESTTIVDNKFDTIFFGSYIQGQDDILKTKIEWIVMDDDKNNHKKLLLSKYILECKDYNEVQKQLNWEECSLRNWLNNYFYNEAFSFEEQSKILLTNNINNGNEKFLVKGGNITQDKVFCLSFDEARKYFNQDDMLNKNYRLCTKGTEYLMKGNDLYVASGNKWYSGNSEFWLRTPGARVDHAMYVKATGAVDYYGYGVDQDGVGVRPAMWISY